MIEGGGRTVSRSDAGKQRGMARGSEKVAGVAREEDSSGAGAEEKEEQDARAKKGDK